MDKQKRLRSGYREIVEDIEDVLETLKRLVEQAQIVIRQSEAFESAHPLVESEAKGE